MTIEHDHPPSGSRGSAPAPLVKPRGRPRTGPDRPTIPWDKIHGAVISAAHRYCQRHADYEIDELVSVFWLSGQYRNMKERGMVWQACRWAWQVYHRSQQSRLQMHPLSAYPDSYGQQYAAVDTLDDIMSHIGGNSRRALAVQWRAQGESLEHIGARLGCSREWARKILRGI